jgi:hypothetical protein
VQNKVVSKSPKEALCNGATLYAVELKAASPIKLSINVLRESELLIHVGILALKAARRELSS